MASWWQMWDLICFEICQGCLEMHEKDKACPTCRELKDLTQHLRGKRAKGDLPVLVVNCIRPDVGCGTVMSSKYKDTKCVIEQEGKVAAHEQDDKLHPHMTLGIVGTSREERLGLKKAALPNFRKKKKSNHVSSFSAFYTYRHGYQMALQVYANGFGPGKGKYVSVFAPILRGKYDARLKWPFLGEVTFTLLNQLEDKGHHTMTLNIENANTGDSWGLSMFILHSALAYDPVKNTQYLKDDILYFWVTVKAADHTLDKQTFLQCAA